MQYTILHIEDNEAVRYLRNRTLRLAGFEVLDAPSGTAGLQLAAERVPSMIVADIRLPDIDGFELCRRLKADPRTVHIPLLQISALGRAEQDYPAALESGADAYLREPVTPEALVATIHALIRANLAERERDATRVMQATAERRAEAAEKYAAAILDTIPEAYILLDTGLRYRYMNATSERLLGKKRDDLIGRSLFEAFPGTLGTELEQQYRKVLTQRTPVAFEYYFEAWQRWYQVRAYPSAEGGIAAYWADITEMKDAQHRADETRGELETVFNSMVDAIAITDARHVRMNPACAELYGFEVNDIESARQSVEIRTPDSVLVPAEDLPYSRAQRGETVRDMELYVRRKDTGKSWVGLYNAAPVLDADGKVRKVVISIHDITERKMVERALAESRQLLELAIEAGGIAAFIWDLRTGNILATPELHRLYGLEVGAADGSYSFWIDRVLPEDREGLEAALAATFAKRESICTFDFRTQWPSGEIRWLHLRARVEFDEAGSPIRMIGANMDVTDRKRLEQALRDSETRLSTLAETVPEILFTGTPNGLIDYISHRFETYSGRDVTALLGHGWVEALHPDDRDTTEAAWWESVRSGSEYKVTYRLRRSDGVYRWFQARAIPMYDADGRVTKWFGVCTDIDDHKRLEERLAERSKELLRSNEDLQRFAYAASHDLQEPLRMIGTFSEVVARKHSGLDPATDSHVRYIREGVDRMRRLISDLLEYSRITHEPLEPKRPTDTRAVVDEALSNLQEAIRESGAHILVDELPQVIADPRSLARVFQNLIGNSLKYRGDKQPIVHVSYAQDDRNWIFSVQDNGIGIDKRYRERIFGVFQRLHSREKYPGSGIGLAVVKRIIERHGGRIWVESEPGAGSIFSFTIPVQPVVESSALLKDDDWD